MEIPAAAATTLQRTAANTPCSTAAGFARAPIVLHTCPLPLLLAVVLLVRDLIASALRLLMIAPCELVAVLMMLM
jgi:hypothetical protein